MTEIRRVCVFCGSSAGRDPEYRETAVAVGRALAQHGIGVVFGGGRMGMMGAVADGALGAGGEAIGVIPEPLRRREPSHEGLTELRLVKTMHERKQLMADLSDAFVMLPGGFGTFEEFCEVLTWAQLGIHAKPCVLVNTRLYFRPIIDMFDHAVAEGFLRPEFRAIVRVVDAPEALVHALRTHRAPEVARWLTAEDA